MAPNYLLPTKIEVTLLRSAQLEFPEHCVTLSTVFPENIYRGCIRVLAQCTVAWHREKHWKLILDFILTDKANKYYDDTYVYLKDYVSDQHRDESGELHCIQSLKHPEVYEAITKTLPEDFVRFILFHELTFARHVPTLVRADCLCTSLHIGVGIYGQYEEFVKRIATINKFEMPKFESRAEVFKRMRELEDEIGVDPKLRFPYEEIAGVKD